MEKQGVLLEKLAQRKKALEKYEKAKRKASLKVEQKNQEKFAMTQQCVEKRQQDVKEMRYTLKKKEQQVVRKLKEAESQRIGELEVKKER